MLVLLLLAEAVLHAGVWTVRQNEIAEISFLSSTEYDNPSGEIELDAIVTGSGGEEYKVPAYWAGGRLWKLRFASPLRGEFRVRTACSDTGNEGLHGRQARIVVLPYDGANPLLKHGPLAINPVHDIVHADGTPFLWLADSWWHGMTSRFRWPADFQILTQDRKRKGFSVIQFAAGFPCDIAEFDPRGANEAGFPTSRDYTRINPAYFDLVDLRVQHLVENGLVPNILGTWGYYLPWFGIENMQRYWRYIIARYGAYPVTWTLAGETTLIYYLTDDERREGVRQFQRDGWAKVAAYIQKIDPFERILTAHPGPASGGFRPISDMSLLDLIMVQPGHGGWDSLPGALHHLRTAQHRFPDRPVMQGEVCFEGMHGGGCDAKLQRILFWTNMLSGAAGHCYGADAIWQFNTEEEVFGDSPGGYAWGNTPWEEAHHWKGSFYVGFGRKILKRFDWHEFEPHPEWIDPSADGDDILDACAAGILGGIRLFYFPRGVMPWGQKYTVRRLDQEAAYCAAFLDPLTGKEHRLPGNISGVSEWEIPHAPILQDWLLVLEKEPTGNGEEGR